MKVRVFAGALLLCVMQASLGLAAERLPAGRVRLRVTVAQYVDDVEGLSSQLAAVSGGQLEPYAEIGFTGFVIVTSDSRAAMVEGDPRVVRVDRVMDETLASAPIAQPRQAAAAQSVAVLAAAAHPGGVVTNAGSTFALGSYGYDASGNITSIGTDQFRYDPLGRLKTSTVTGSSQEYTYDRFGNLGSIRTGGTTLSIGVDAATNRLSSSPANNMYGEYDAAGQMIEYLDRDVFTYDELGMVKEWNDPEKRKVYLYTADDERIAAVAISGGAETTSEWTIRDLSGKVLRVYTKTMVGGERWTWKEDYIYRDGQLLAAEVNTPEKTLHFHLDHLGTPRLITGNGGATVAKHTYYPFGVEITSPNQDAERMKFTGHERDYPSGSTSSPLDYMHARYYIPGAGRFLSVDPVMDIEKALVQPQRWNRYSYVENSPINRIDPDGRQSAGFVAYSIAKSDQAAYERGEISHEELLLRSEARLKAAEFTVGGLLGGGALGRVVGAVRGLLRLGRAGNQDSSAPSEPTLRPDVKVSGGRSGQDVKTTTGPPNSIIRGSDGRIYQTNDKGQIIADITTGRVKPITPGQGFGPKRPPTEQELSWLERMARAIRDLVK